MDFARRVKQHLRPRQITGFSPHLIGGFDGKATQLIDVALVAHLRIQGRTCRDVPFLLVDMKQDIVIGRKWFEEHDVMLDVRRRQLLFPEGFQRETIPAEVAMDEEVRLSNPAFIAQRNRYGTNGDNPANDANDAKADCENARHRRLREAIHQRMTKLEKDLDTTARGITPNPPQPEPREYVNLEPRASPCMASHTRRDEGLRQMDRALRDKTQIETSRV